MARCKNPSYRELLKQAILDLVALSEERIKLGETNVKTHMFLCVILAQVEAVETSAPVELGVARAARDSLEMCNNLLRMREDSSIIHSDDLDLAIAEMEKTGTGDGLGPDIFFPDTAFSLWKE